ncbi:MAG: hypothetical protein ACE5K9_09320 [Candidatus Methylomirabilales bacterium]
MFRQRMQFGHLRLLVTWVPVVIVVLGGCSSNISNINEALMERVGQEGEFNSLQGDGGGPIVLDGWITRLRPSGELTVLEVESSSDSINILARSRREILVVHRGPLDPRLYCPGRPVRVVGVIRKDPTTPGKDAPELGARPVLEADSIHLHHEHTAFRSFAPASSFLFPHDPFSSDPFPPHHPNYRSFHRSLDPFHRPYCH